MEVESIQPIALCGKSTRIVVAGDVLVTPLEKFYPQVKTGALSLLERLRNKYPFRHPFVINLVQNYTSIEAILKVILIYTTRLFFILLISLESRF